VSTATGRVKAAGGENSGDQAGKLLNLAANCPDFLEGRGYRVRDVEVEAASCRFTIFGGKGQIVRRI
jgi:hypothetical protein